MWLPSVLWLSHYLFFFFKENPKPKNSFLASPPTVLGPVLLLLPLASCNLLSDSLLETRGFLVALTFFFSFGLSLSWLWIRFLLLL